MNTKKTAKITLRALGAPCVLSLYLFLYHNFILNICSIYRCPLDDQD